MWYRFAIKDTPWENFFETEGGEKDSDVLIKWYDWASCLLSKNWLEETSRHYDAVCPPMAIIELVEKPTRTWIEDAIQKEVSCALTHEKNIASLKNLLK
jgi:hypothetical protein